MAGDSHRAGGRAPAQNPWRSSPALPTREPADQAAPGYRIGARLHHAGNVYEARHPRFPGRLAIKLFPWAVGEAPAAVTAFAREAGRVSILRHPRIAQVLDSGVLPDRTPFVAMEFLPGQTLEDLLGRRGLLTISQAFTVIRDIVLGLSAAHEAGVVHREIRPDNIFLVGRADAELGFVKVLDFGVSQLTWAAHAPGQGITVEAARYLAPEQVRRGLLGVDARADEYALAVLTYRMLRGPDPFLGPSIARASAVDSVLGKALHESPGERYASVGAFFRAFEEAIISSVNTPAPTQRRAARGRSSDKDITREVALMTSREPQATPPPREVVQATPPPREVVQATPPPQEEVTVAREVIRSAPVAREMIWPRPVAREVIRPAPHAREVPHAEEVIRPAPVAREVINTEGTLAERFFEEGDRHEQDRWQNAPVARHAPAYHASELSFTSFDRVPRRRKPLATVLLLAAIVGGGFVWQRFGWRSPRAVWDESAIGRTVYLFRAGLPWNQTDSAAEVSSPAPVVAPPVPAPAPAPSVVASPSGVAAAPAVVAEPAGVVAEPVVAEPAGVAAPAPATAPAGAVAPPPSPKEGPRARRGAASSSQNERGSALRGYVWSPREQRLVPAPR